MEHNPVRQHKGNRVLCIEVQLSFQATGIPDNTVSDGRSCSTFCGRIALRF